MLDLVVVQCLHRGRQACQKRCAAVDNRRDFLGLRCGKHTSVKLDTELLEQPDARSGLVPFKGSLKTSHGCLLLGLHPRPKTVFEKAVLGRNQALRVQTKFSLNHFSDVDQAVVL